RSLSRRFVVALLIVVATTVGSFLAVHWQLHKSDHDGYLINISGRQRMLSQRIALLASRLDASGEGTEAQSTLIDLHSAIKRMSAAHERLRESATAAPELQSLFAGSDGIDESVLGYLDLARSLINKTAAEPSLVIEDLVETAADGNLLAKLDAYVEALEDLYDSKLSTFQIVLLVLALLSIAALLVMAFAIFKPTIELVTENQKRLEQSNTELMEFSYRISHDLRAPVVAATGVVEIARDSLDLGDHETTTGCLERVSDSLAKVAGTIEDIVSLIKNQMTDAEPEVFFVSKLLEQSMETVRNMDGFEEVDFEIYCPKDLAVRNKRVYLKQSLDNLISNALKYRDPDEKQSRVSIDAAKVGAEVKISIADNGLGIDEAFHDKLFGMFQRFHPRAAFGTGLGLYLVSKNAAAMDGDVSFKALEKGSQFDISFPSLGA
ncbi:MAG: ATP-binding protein, partial [Lacipirellulaceae bacterium]